MYFPEKGWDPVTFSIINYVCPENFNEIHKAIQKIWRFSSSIVQSCIEFGLVFPEVWIGGQIDTPITKAASKGSALLGLKVKNFLWHYHLCNVLFYKTENPCWSETQSSFYYKRNGMCGEDNIRIPDTCIKLD